MQKIKKILIKIKEKTFKIGGYVFVVLVLGLVSYSSFLIILNEPSDIANEPSDDKSGGFEDCNVAGINLHGGLMTYIPQHAEGDTDFDYDVSASEDIMWMIDQANEDPNIKAIILEVDSGGGSGVAGEEISNAVENSEKPVVAFIRDIGLSASYWAISGVDKIFASKNSDIGSIGVTMSYLDNVVRNKKEGYTYEQLSSGKYKDSGNPDKPLNDEERAIFLRDVNIMHQNFIEAVSKNRKIPIKKVREFSDGSTVMGEQAIELGLIDQIGGINEVEKYIEGQIGEKPEICWQ